MLLTVISRYFVNWYSMLILTIKMEFRAESFGMLYHIPFLVWLPPEIIIALCLVFLCTYNWRKLKWSSNYFQIELKSISKQMHRVSHLFNLFLRGTSPRALHTPAPLWPGCPSDLTRLSSRTTPGGITVPLSPLWILCWILGLPFSWFIS